MLQVRECKTADDVRSNVKRTQNYFKNLEPSLSERLRAVTDELAAVKAERDQYRALCHQLRDRRRNVLLGPVTPEKIKIIICDHFQIDVETLTSLTRNPDYLMARHMGMYLCRLLTRDSELVIARVFGRSDHATVSYAEKKITRLRVTDPEVNELAEILIQQIKAKKDAE